MGEMLAIRSDSRMTNLLTIAGIMLIAVAIFMAWGTSEPSARPVST